MQKTKIEWCDYTWNPVKGLCPQACWYCYARAMYKRFKWDEVVRWSYKEWQAKMPLDPARIFVGSMIDLMHEQIPSSLIEKILRRIRLYPQHTFIFLTKNPARYAEFDFPDNCWLGVTVTNQKDCYRHSYVLERHDPKNLWFVSYEPLLGEIDMPMPSWSNWDIIGALTGPSAKKFTPTKEAVERIFSIARLYKRPVFLKDNLKAVWGEKLIQEWPQ